MGSLRVAGMRAPSSARECTMAGRGRKRGVFADGNNIGPDKHECVLAEPSFLLPMRRLPILSADQAIWPARSQNGPAQAHPKAHYMWMWLVEAVRSGG